MPVQSRDLLDGLLADNERALGPRRMSWAFPGSKIAATIAWCGAVYTTFLTVFSLQRGTPWWISIIVALVVQFVLTMAERPIMRGRPGVFTVAVFLLDAIINAGGVFPMLRNVGSTPAAQMLAASGTSPIVDTTPAILLSLVVGIIIATAPEALWRMKE